MSFLVTLLAKCYIGPFPLLLLLLGLFTLQMTSEVDSPSKTFHIILNLNTDKRVMFLSFVLLQLWSVQENIHFFNNEQIITRISSKTIT